MLFQIQRVQKIRKKKNDKQSPELQVKQEGNKGENDKISSNDLNNIQINLANKMKEFDKGSIIININMNNNKCSDYNNSCCCKFSKGFFFNKCGFRNPFSYSQFISGLSVLSISSINMFSIIGIGACNICCIIEIGASNIGCLFSFGLLDFLNFFNISAASFYTFMDCSIKNDNIMNSVCSSYTKNTSLNTNTTLI